MKREKEIREQIIHPEQKDEFILQEEIKFLRKEIQLLRQDVEMLKKKI